MKIIYRFQIFGTLAIGVCFTGLTCAQSATFTIDGAGAAGNLGNSANFTATGTFTESFTARSLTWSGQLTSNPNSFFFEEDVFASIRGPNGLGYTGALAGEQGIFLGTTPFSGWSAGFAPASIDGDWSFEAYTPNTFPDSTNWSMLDSTFSFNADLFPEARAIAIGTRRVDPITEGEILWYSVDHAGGAIEFSTDGSRLAELEGVIQPNDTIVALYDSTGALVDLDIDGGAGFTSLLSIANLAGGEYHLAVTGYTLGTRIGSNFIATSHDGEGTISLSVVVPSPAVGIVAVGCLGFALRRRQQADGRPFCTGSRTLSS